MPTRIVLIVVALLSVLATFTVSSPSTAAATRAAQARLLVSPAEVHLEGNFERAQLVVREANAEGKTTPRSPDRTADAQFRSSDPAVATVDPRGRVHAVGNGQATIQVQVGPSRHDVPVTVKGISPQPVVRFHRQVRPILNKAGCAAAACHAAQHGKGGFKLSVFGFDPRADHRAIVRDRLQRRVNFVQPEASLLLQKPSLQAPHGGGRRLRRDSPEFATLKAWIAAGAPAPRRDAAKVEQLLVEPARRVTQPGQRQQLRVVAVYSDKTRRDVTALAKFDTMDDGVVSVDDSGRVEVVGKGQAPVMVRFEGAAEISMFVAPYSDTATLAGWKNNNFVDELAGAKFRELGLEPSPLCDDATFIRRAFLDCTGALPTPEQTTAFLKSTDPDKRNQLVDELLGLTGDPKRDIHNDRYAAFWTLKWSDLIRNNSKDVGEQGMWALHNWIRESFRVNRPFDQFVRELVTAKGSIYMNGPANYFRINRDSSKLTEATAQLFLGIRLECAKCHHHPFEKFSQADYYGLAAFFARVGSKNSEEFGLFGRETVIVVKSSGGVRHPRTGKTLPPTPLDGEPLDHPIDRRIPLAKWLTGPQNRYFARSVVNRYVGYLLGRGLVEPLDDMRATNPPSNVALMDALAKHFVDSRYDLKQLIRVIMQSRLYQLQSQPTPANAGDRRFYSHFKVKRLGAEPLLDAIDDVTGVRTKFKSLPLGTRAIELPDAEYPNYFLTTFAKPRRASVCECERMGEENLVQALHTLNGDTLTKKIAAKAGRVARLLKQKKKPESIVQELFLVALCRMPTAEEAKAAAEIVQEAESPQQGYEDLLWGLMNSKHFLFVR